MSVALVKIQIRNDTAQAWAAANPLLSDGEPGAESNTGRLKIGNGIDRWLELPYVGGDGSGGGGSVNPISGTIDGGIFTGNPRTVDAGPPIQPAASKATVDEYEVLVVSWGPAAVDDPSSVAITQYAVEYSTDPSDDSSWSYGGQSNAIGDPVLNYAPVVAPVLTDPNNDYYYRVKAVLDNGGNAEWGYSPVYRHFKSVDPISFSLSATSTDIGSTGEDNSTVISIEGLTGGGSALQGPFWTYPEVTGIKYTEDGETLSLENTNGTDTVNQDLFIQCRYTTSYFDPSVEDGVPINGDLVVSQTEVQTIQITLSNTSDPLNPNPNPEPTPGEILPIFNWAPVDDATEEPPGLVSSSSNSWASLPGIVGNWPVGYYPNYYYKQQCAGNSGSCATTDFVDPKCGVEYGLEISFTDFSFLFNATNGNTAFANTVNGELQPQYKKVSIAGGTACTNDPIVVLSDQSQENLLARNVLYSREWRLNGDGTQNPYAYVWNFYSGYQIVDRVEINGVTASYMLLRPFAHSLVPGPGYEQHTGMLLKTFDQGSTFQYVDPRGIGTQQVEGVDDGSSDNYLPKMLLKAKSVTTGREALVALFEYESDASSVVQQFYYTDDHIVWRPCSNADRLTNTVNKVWTDPATGTSYATDEERTGELDNGVYRYWKSEQI